jgi:flagellar biosynthetic protein FliO
MHFELLQASAHAGSAARDLPGGYGASLLQSMLALAAVCILAWVVLRWSAARGLGTGAGQRMKVIERVPLDARRWVYLVEIGERVLVVGAGDGASPTLLAELKKGELPDAPPSRSFLEVLRKKDTSATAATRGVEAAAEPIREREDPPENAA